MDGEHRHRLAVVDCGTNTFTLHVARLEPGGWKPVFRQRRFVRLGHDSFRTGRLSPLRMRRGLDVLASFRETALNFGVTHVRAIGCSALRDAANGAEFVAGAGERGWAIEVIDGDREADWIQRGVADTVGPDVLGEDTALTLDIGGGSVETVLWDRQAIRGRFSLDLGVARLTDWIKPSDPLKAKDLDSLARIADQALAPLLALASDHPPRVLVGTSGAFNTLAALESPEANWNPRNIADVLPYPTLRSRCRALRATSKRDLATIPNLHPDRIPYMSIACALIEHLLERMPSVTTVLRSRHTLAEGVLSEAAEVLPTSGLSSEWGELTDR